MWIDAIIIAVFLFFLWRGYEKGFLKNFVYLIGWVISLGAAFYLWKPTKVFIQDHLSLAEDFTLLIQEKITSIMAAQEVTPEAGQTVDPTGIFAIPSKIAEFLQETANQAGVATATPIAELVADICMSILAFLVIVILAKIATNLIIKLFDFMEKVPIISTVNGLLGACMGALKGIIVIMLMLMLLVPVLTVTDNDILTKAYDNAKITPYLYDKNPIFLLWKG